MRSSPAVTRSIEESPALDRKGDIVTVWQRTQQALEKAGALGDPSVRAAALVTPAFVHFRQGHYTTASSLAEEALLQAGPETPARADALPVLGMCATETDDLTAVPTMTTAPLTWAGNWDITGGCCGQSIASPRLPGCTAGRVVLLPQGEPDPGGRRVR